MDQFAGDEACLSLAGDALIPTDANVDPIIADGIVRWTAYRRFDLTIE